MCHLNLFISARALRVLRIGLAVGLAAGVLVQAQPLLCEQAERRRLGRNSNQNHVKGLTRHLIDLPGSTDHSWGSTDLGGELVVYPSPQVAFICGPQLKAGSRLNPFPWFDRMQIKYGHTHGREA